MSTWIPIIKSLYLFALAPRTGRTRSSINKTASGAVIWPNPGGFRGGSHPRRAHARTVGTRWNVLAPPRALMRKLLEVFGAMSLVHRVTSCFLAPLMPPGHVFHGCVRWKKEERVRQSALNRVWDNAEGHCRPEPAERSGPRGSPPDPVASDCREGVATCPRCHLWRLAQPAMFPTDAPALQGPGDAAEYVVTCRTLWPRNSGQSCHL